MVLPSLIMATINIEKVMQFDEFTAKLQQSSIALGVYTPSSAVKAISHAAVLVNGTPLFLTGQSSIPRSIKQAEHLCLSHDFLHALHFADFVGKVSFGHVRGVDIHWPSQCFVLIHKTRDRVELADELAPIRIISLAPNTLPLITELCLSDNLSSIISTGVPSSPSNGSALLNQLPAEVRFPSVNGMVEFYRSCSN